MTKYKLSKGDVIKSMNDKNFYSVVVSDSEIAIIGLSNSDGSRVNFQHLAAVSNYDIRFDDGIFTTDGFKFESVKKHYTISQVKEKS